MGYASSFPEDEKMIDPGERTEVIITLLAVLGVCALIAWLLFSARV